MALLSRRFKVAEAIKATLDADTDLRDALGGGSNAISWKIRKQAVHSGANWLFGAYVCPSLVDLNERWENAKDSVTIRTFVGMIDPNSDGDLETNMERSLGIIERVEDIFRNKAGSDMPARFRTLTATWEGDNKGSVERLDYEPGGAFLATLLQAGYDACGVVITTQITVVRRNVSNLGA